MNTPLHSDALSISSTNLPACLHPIIPRADTLTFLRGLDPTESQYCFRSLPEKFEEKASKLDLRPAQARNYTTAGIENFSSGIYSQLCSVNTLMPGAVSGIFLTINQSNGKGVKAKHINRIRAAFVELDHGELTDREYTLFAEHYGASCIVESSPGKAHVYWYTKLPDEHNSAEHIFPIDKFTKIQEILQYVFRQWKPGPESIDTPRILRVPGFWHMKVPTKPFLSRLVHIDPIRRYNIEELLIRVGIDNNEKLFAAQTYINSSPSTPSKNGNGTLSHLLQTSIGKDHGEYLGAAAGGRNSAMFHYALSHVFSHRGLNFDEGLGVMLLVNKKNTPPLDASEVEHVTRSAWERFCEVHGGRASLSPGQAVKVFQAWNTKAEQVEQDDEEMVFPAISSLPEFDENFQYDYHKSEFLSPVSEISIVERIVQRYGHILCFNPARGMHVYDNRRWVHELTTGINSKALVHNLIKPVVSAVGLEQAALITTQKPNGTFDEAKIWTLKTRLGSAALYRNLDALLPLRDDLFAAPDLFDSDDSLLGVENGIVSMSSGRLLPHSPDFRITKLAPIRWSEKSECPEFDAFLDSFTCNDKDMTAYLWRMMGYLLSGHISEQVLFFLYGTGANGKSRFCEVLYDLLGSDYASYIPAGTLVGKIDKMGGRGEAPSPNLVNLIGKRLAICMEIDQNQEWQEATIKDLTSDEPMTARGLHKDPVTFRPKAKIVVRSNHMPVVRGTDDGIWRRFHPIPCDLRLPKKQQDKELRDKLSRELPGILKKAVQGYQEWLRGGLQPPARIIEASEKYQRINSPVRYFVNMFCVKEEDLGRVKPQPEFLYPRGCSPGEFFAAYSDWARRQEGTIAKEGNPNTPVEMGKELRSLGLSRKSYRVDDRIMKLYPLYISKEYLDD